MSKYIINRNVDSRGNNEIHNLNSYPSCGHLPKPENQVLLGNFSTDKQALEYAKKNGWKNADGCYYCCKDAHTK